MARSSRRSPDSYFGNRSPELVFLIVATALVISFGITTIFIREPEAPPRTREPMRVDIGGYLRDLAGRRDLLLYIGAASLYWMGTGGVLPYLTRFGVSVLGLSEGESFQLLLPALAGTIVGAVPSGYLADRHGKKPVLAIGVLAYSVIALVASQVATLPVWRMAYGPR